MAKIETFIGNKEVQRILNVGRTKAYQIMNMLLETYEINDEKLPRKGVIPLSILEEYYGQKHYHLMKK